MIKYRCKDCGHCEKMRFRDFTAFFVLTILAALGMVHLLLPLLSDVAVGTNLFEQRQSVIVSDSFTEFAKQHDDELRSVALDLTSKCSGDYPYCYAASMYSALLEDVKYVPTSKHKILYEPLYVLNNGGDCKNTAVLFTSLMQSLGFDSQVSCNTSANHCLSKVPLKYSGSKEYDTFLIVDLAKMDFKTVNESADIWN